MKKAYRCIDLFAGIGGIRLGFEKAGFQTVFANDMDAHAATVYAANHGPIVCKPLEEVDLLEIPKYDVLLGGFPCQPFSRAGKGHGFEDVRGNAFFVLEHLIDRTRPKAFMFENVKALVSHEGGETLKTILRSLRVKLGYQVHVAVLNAKDFGVPQKRERVFIVGFKNPKIDFSFNNLKRKAPKPLKEILEKGAHPSHYLSKQYMDGLIKHKQRHSDAGSNFGYCVLDPEGIANTFVAGNMGRERNLVKDRILPSDGGEGADLKSPINTLGIRRLTVNECKALQGFNKGFKMPVTVRQAYKLLGNSVAVPVIREIAKEMKRAMDTASR
ncbi:MAG: DNA cytosine methyltransferase [Patescibacteria group bacterium]|nr:MAG: DNA cytosine methyltransferase [Patescibacteria group bacterium]